MPLHEKTETHVENGKKIKYHYFQWGTHGKKYYYKIESERSRTIAKNKAMKQARVIAWSRYGN